MTTEEARKQGEALMKCSSIVMVGTNGPNGYPYIKAMFSRETEGMHTCWLTTNTSSKRVAQLRENSQSSIYFVDAPRFQGLLLTGSMEVLLDEASRQRIWRDGDEMYYPLGVSDPDYAVLKFTATEANYYHGLCNITFSI